MNQFLNNKKTSLLNKKVYNNRYFYMVFIFISVHFVFPLILAEFLFYLNFWFCFAL